MCKLYAHVDTIRLVSLTLGGGYVSLLVTAGVAGCIHFAALSVIEAMPWSFVQQKKENQTIFIIVWHRICFSLFSIFNFHCYATWNPLRLFPPYLLYTVVSCWLPLFCFL